MMQCARRIVSKCSAMVSKLDNLNEGPVLPFGKGPGGGILENKQYVSQCLCARVSLINCMPVLQKE